MEDEKDNVLPENEEAEAIGETTNIFNRRMLSNSLKIMNGKFGGGFYVNYQFDKMNGFGCLKLMLEYPDGEVFAIPICKNVCKPIETDDERNGVARAKEKLPPDAPPRMRSCPREIIPKVSALGYYVESEAFVKYERPDFPIPITVRAKRIAELWEKIPIEVWCGSFTYAEVYQALLDVGENKVEQYREDGYVLFTKKEVEDVAEEMGYDFLTIRNVFESRKLWKKDRNSLGYQYSKKINGKVERFYALKKINEQCASKKINEEFSIGYTEYLPKKEILTPQVPNLVTRGTQ